MQKNNKPTSADEWFAQALNLPAGEARTAFLSQLVAQDAALGEEIRSLVQAHEHAGDFLNPPTAKDEPFPQLPGFTIERKIGQGGLGIVYAARDEKLNRPVAIKVLRGRPDQPHCRRILDEARKAAALRDPAIITIYSVLDDNPECPAIVMEWVEGFSLDRFCAELNFDQKARLLRDVARGLSTAHEHGIIHRDLKPDNIIVGPDMRPRILDFGLALSIEEARGAGSGFEGTPFYASPEQALSKPLTAASDVFSFGSLMYKILTGRPPFAGENRRQVLEAIATTAPPFPREAALGVPEDLQAICLACMAADPLDRPAASGIVVELNRFLLGEPVRLRPRLYGDVLQRTISEYSGQAQAWQNQSIISRDERDSLEEVHRRLLSAEDHWIIEARRITPLQTLLTAGTWLAVVATVLTVWKLRPELGSAARWTLPTFFTLTLLMAGYTAHRLRETLATATFLAGAVLAAAPCILAVLAQTGCMSTPPPHVKQLFADNFTNQQVFAALLSSLAISAVGLWRLKITGFAWTTATLGTFSYLGFLLLCNWLDQKIEIKALWCLPLVVMETVALALEKRGRVRWTLPFHLTAMAALVLGLDLIALNGPTLQMLGLETGRWAYLDSVRQKSLSIVLNGVLFLLLTLLADRSKSLDLRRASRWLEVLAILHTLSALAVNAMEHKGAAYVRADVALYLAAALLFALLAPLRSRWRSLVGGLAGCGLGSYLLIELGLVNKKPFVIGLGLAGIVLALGAFVYARRAPRQSSNQRRDSNSR